ncbi:hypothetical protein PC116_g28459 [Phytophthora cactorum]|nr:hypothetical protein Pcac1_g18725 [Phytophthora cactorum]KAG4223067.1 hypothetical protein PC116_g28459 [Phytophthora cactorum]
MEALMKNDEWMQLFKPIPKRKTEWPAFAHELQYPVNSVSTSQVADDSVSLLLALGYENETYSSTMSLQDWNPHEAGAALQKWKKKLRKTFGAIGINEGKQPVSRLATLEEDPSEVPLPATPKRLERSPTTKRGADRDAFGTADASPYIQDSHMVTPRSTAVRDAWTPRTRVHETVAAGRELQKIVREVVRLILILLPVMTMTYCLLHTTTKILKPS